MAYGLEKVKDKSYSASVSLNLFDRKRKITFSGNAGRMALNDLPDARYRDEGNKNKNHGLWGNYSSQINKKLQVSGNYRWNANVNNSASLSRQEYLPTGNYESRVYDNESHSNSDNQSMELILVWITRSMTRTGSGSIPILLFPGEIRRVCPGIAVWKTGIP